MILTIFHPIFNMCINYLNANSIQLWSQCGNPNKKATFLSSGVKVSSCQTLKYSSKLPQQFTIVKYYYVDLWLDFGVFRPCASKEKEKIYPALLIAPLLKTLKYYLRGNIECITSPRIHLWACESWIKDEALMLVKDCSVPLRGWITCVLHILSISSKIKGDAE